MINIGSKNVLRVMKFDIEIAKTTPTSFGQSMNSVPWTTRWRLSRLTRRVPALHGFLYSRASGEYRDHTARLRGQVVDPILLFAAHHFDDKNASFIWRIARLDGIWIGSIATSERYHHDYVLLETNTSYRIIVEFFRKAGWVDDSDSSLQIVSMCCQNRKEILQMAFLC